jgi:hypothetical protein
MPRDTEELTGEEAEATKGGFWYAGYMAQLKSGETPEDAAHLSDLVEPGTVKLKK